MSKDSGIERVTVSLPTELLQVLDELGRNLGHNSRSETVRAATRDYIAEHRFGDEEGWRVGVMMLQYNHQNMKIVQQINHLKGRFRNLIKSSLYISTSEDDTMEIIAIRGETDNIKELINEAMKIRRIKLLRWLLTLCGRAIP